MAASPPGDLNLNITLASEEQNFHEKHTNCIISSTRGPFCTIRMEQTHEGNLLSIPLEGPLITLTTVDHKSTITVYFNHTFHCSLSAPLHHRSILSGSNVSCILIPGLVLLTLTWQRHGEDRQSKQNPDRWSTHFDDYCSSFATPGLGSSF